MHLFKDPEFWVLIAVAIFVALVWKPGKRILIGSLDDRADRIRQELDAARNLRDEARQQWGAGFSLSRFHGALLSLGSPPLGLMGTAIVRG